MWWYVVLLLAEEEKDVDDWDVDMSVYYDADGGDKDARDMMTMRREARRCAGRQLTLADSTYKSAIGKFERHSKVLAVSFLRVDGMEAKISFYGLSFSFDAETCICIFCTCFLL